MATDQKSIAEMLSAFEETNHAANHGCSFYLRELPQSESIELSLDKYFSNFVAPGSPTFPGEGWKVRTKPIHDRLDIAKKIQSWFFSQKSSPGPKSSSADDVTLDFLMQLNSEIGEGMTYEVHVSPPICYDCALDDFAFVGKNESWLLHLGVSD